MVVNALASRALACSARYGRLRFSGSSLKRSNLFVALASSSFVRLALGVSTDPLTLEPLSPADQTSVGYRRRRHYLEPNQSLFRGSE